MQEPRAQSGETEAPAPLRERALERAVDWARQFWRPAGTLVAVALALIIGWGVVNGRHGLSAWQRQRTEDKTLKQEIHDLQQENTRLRDHIQRLKSDPDTIEREARDQLHYARPGEVIYKLPAQPKPQNSNSNP
ncbi:MAG: septum formation initiator family protein [Terracidiphilus sp.]